MLLDGVPELQSVAETVPQCQPLVVGIYGRILPVVLRTLVSKVDFSVSFIFPSFINWNAPARKSCLFAFLCLPVIYSSIFFPPV